MSLAGAPLPAPNTSTLVAAKQRQHATWSLADYSAVGVTLQLVGEDLAEALELVPGERVLDVAAGNGNATLAAARRHCNVVSSDYVAARLKDGMARAKAEGLSVAFREADAEDLPFDDASFDVTMSTFGAMFTADQDAAAQELLRVTRPDGRIGLANWTPGSFMGHVFKTIGRHVPPPAGVRSPLEWGTRDRLDALFRANAQRIVATPKAFVFRYRSAAEWVDTWRQAYGPIANAFQTVGEDGAAALEAELIALGTAASEHTKAMVVPSEYIEVIITRA